MKYLVNLSLLLLLLIIVALYILIIYWANWPYWMFVVNLGILFVALVVARFILKYNTQTGEPTDLQLLVNGQSVSAEEFYSLYPNPFDQFDDGNRMHRELPKIPKP